MSNPKEESGLHELAGGWISERKGMPIPAFLKLAYIGFGLFGLWYLFAFWMGETDHASRGVHVQALNTAIGTPAGWWHTLLAVILGLFVAGLFWFTFVGKAEE